MVAPHWKAVREVNLRGLTTYSMIFDSTDHFESSQPGPRAAATVPAIVDECTSCSLASEDMVVCSDADKEEEDEEEDEEEGEEEEEAEEGGDRNEESLAHLEQPGQPSWQLVGNGPRQPAGINVGPGSAGRHRKGSHANPLSPLEEPPGWCGLHAPTSLAPSDEGSVSWGCEAI